MVIYEGTKALIQKSSIKNAKVILNNGTKMPVIGLGTFRIRGKELIFNVVKDALKAGYRSFDTASVYGNESDIGEALKALLPQYNLKREDIFITSKLAPRDQGKTHVRRAVEDSLKKLGVSYIDLYLIHWPGAGNIQVADPENKTLRQESWDVLVSLQEEGKLKAVGVSNYTAKHLNDLFSHSSVAPAVNQVEFHPFYQHPDELLDICGKHNILLQAYSSFGGTGEKSLLTNATITQISKKLNIQPSQLLLRWALQHGYAIIPKTVNLNRMEENLLLDFEIPDEDMTVINSIPLQRKFAWDPESVV